MILKPGMLINVIHKEKDFQIQGRLIPSLHSATKLLIEGSNYTVLKDTSKYNKLIVEVLE